MFRALKIILTLVLCAFILSASDCYSDYENDSKVWGYKPVYTNDLQEVFNVLPQQPLRRPGKIYVYQNKLFINEKNSGIHVYDNINPESPQYLYFVSIYGNNDISIKNGILYADQGPNLLTLDLNSINADSLRVSKQDGIFHTYGYSEALPPAEDVYYQCPDFDLGFVKSWELDSIYYRYACHN